jgi:hypothetical protein
MQHFITGFEKQALVAATLGAGIGIGGAYATAKKEMEVSKLKEQAITPSKNLKEFISKLKPGDVLYSGTRWGSTPEGSTYKKLGFKALPLLSGDLKYHSMVYTGNGKVIDAERRRDRPSRLPDIAEVSLASKFKGVGRKDLAITAYSPAGVDNYDRAKAVEGARSLVGALYPTDGEMFVKALKVLSGVPGKKSAITKDDPIVCQDVAVKAHPDKFPKRHLTVTEMQYNPMFDPVARLGDLRHSPKDQVIADELYPALKALRAGGKGFLTGMVADTLGSAYKNRRK